MTILTGFSPPARGLVVAAAGAIVLMFLRVAESVFAPILLAFFIAVVAAPPLRWMQRKGVPKWGALALVVFVLLDVGSILALITTGALEGFRNTLPDYQERLTLLNEQFGLWLEDIGIANSREALPDIFDPALVAVLVRLALSNMGTLFASGLLVLLMVVFILLEAPGLWLKLQAAYGLKEESEARMRQMLKVLNRYMVIKTGTSLATALFIWAWLSFLGIDFAILWAILAFLLNFVPYVGSFLMAVPAVLMALVQADLQTALLVTLGYLLANVLIGTILEPRIMGRGLGISPLAVLLSLLLWSWALGTVGAFLAVPLTMVLMIALEASPHTRPVSILLGPDINGLPESASTVPPESAKREPGTPPESG